MSSFLFGTPESFEQRSLLRPEQEPLIQQLLKASGGSFGDAANYYRSLLSNRSEDFNAFAAPELRQFREETIPSIAEQFAGMGAGGLSSSSFRNATASAGADLGERLGAIRARLRENAAQGLMGLGQQGLQQFSQNIHRPAQPGFLSEYLGPALAAAGTAIGGPALGAVGSGLGNLASNAFKPKTTLGGEQRFSAQSASNYMLPPGSTNSRF